MTPYLAILGLSAALFGRWVERVGPRKAMFVAALCFGGGFIVAAIGVHFHSLLLVYLGYGVLGGCGLGIGYISPVSTLIKWFPDRPGVAKFDPNGRPAAPVFSSGGMYFSVVSTLILSSFPSGPSKVYV